MKKVRLCIFVIWLLSINISYSTVDGTLEGYENVVDEIIMNFMENNESFEIECDGQAYTDMKHILYDSTMQGIDSNKSSIFWNIVLDELPEYTRYSILDLYDNYHINPSNMLINISVVYSHSIEEKETVFNGANKVFDESFYRLSDREKMLKIHNYIIQNINYDYEVESLYAFGPLPFFDKEKNSGEMVCQGYAMICDLLCELADLDAYIVEGQINGTNHLWNKVKLDGKWYHFDITSDDQLSDQQISYQYFGLSDDEIKKTYLFEVIPPLCVDNLNMEGIK